MIFIVTMALSGALVLTSTYLLWQVVQRRRVLDALGIFGVGLLGIAVFPGNVATWHPWFALVCKQVAVRRFGSSEVADGVGERAVVPSYRVQRLVGGSVAAILSRTILDAPVRYFAATLGTIALVANVVGLEFFEDWGPQAWIGIGGEERWIAYPVLLWLVLLGCALMTRGAPATSDR